MGGMGKTQLALQYAHQSIEKYEVILWILADSSITIGQSFRDIARGLQLCQTLEEVQDSAAAVWKVRNWLGSTNSIDEDIFLQGFQTETGSESEFEFLADEMDLGDAETPLLQAALINKAFSEPILSLHRLVQHAAIRRLPDSDRPKYFDAIVHLLSWGFPDTWSKDASSSLNNIALAYTEMGSLDEAYSTHQLAIDIRLRTSSDRIGNSYSNMASLLLRMGKPDEAEEMLARCPSLKDFTDETFLTSKALAFRQRLLGNRLKTCDSIELLKQLVDIAGALNEGEGQLARAFYKLSTLYTEKGAVLEAEASKTKAIEIRNRLRPQEKDAAFDEESFSKLTLGCFGRTDLDVIRTFSSQ
ncbi:hypothetical protein F5B21DRAFT_520394 [Xylaria acuta]|nr:hypothetical protein F5B21DRAFT_520394 [Xylaria acuta]